MAGRLDPNRNTREEFTAALQQQPVPEDAHPVWKDLVETLKEMQSKLLYHDAMAQNRVQTFMTPAASKNRVYFMWDSVSRTLPVLYTVPPRLNSRGEMDQELANHWLQDCVGKAAYLAHLILDTTPGALNTMMEQLYPDQKGRHPDFGSDVIELARKVVSICERGLDTV